MEKILIKNVKIKRQSTTEACVSQREVWYDIYVNEEYFATKDDICDALDLKEELEKSL